MSILIFIAAVAILIAIGYSLLVHRLAPNQSWNWRNTFVATVVSVIFVLVIGIALFNYQVSLTEEARTQQLRSLLAAELSGTIRILESEPALTILLPNSNATVLITYVQPLILEDAARSGLFDSVQTENMLHLAGKMRIYNTKVSYLLSVLATGPSNPNFEHQTLHAVQNVEDTRRGIVESSRFLLTQMNLSLSPSVNC